MSDSVTKYFDMQEDKQPMIFETPDNGKTVTMRAVGAPIEDRVVITKPTFERLENRIVSEGHKKQAYQILVEYPEEAILEAARILKVGK